MGEKDTAVAGSLTVIVATVIHFFDDRSLASHIFTCCWAEFWLELIP
jgi:hypothetical protein